MLRNFNTFFFLNPVENILISEFVFKYSILLFKNICIRKSWSIGVKNSNWSQNKYYKFYFFKFKGDLYDIRWKLQTTLNENLTIQKLSIHKLKKIIKWVKDYSDYYMVQNLIISMSFIIFFSVAIYFK